MYTMESTINELLQNEAVRSFLETTMPQMMQPPASDYIAAMTAAQVREILPPEAKELMTSVIDIANGREPSFIPQDPHTVPASVSLGRMNDDYSIDDVDGPMYMLDHRFSGCILLQFSKTMQEEQNGTVTCGDVKCPYVFTRVSAAGNIQLLGVFVRNVCQEYGTEYTLHLEGFVDEDGLTVPPSDVSFCTKPENLPDPAYAEHDALALRAAAESIVLLKNENGLLPLEPQPLYVHGADTFRVSAVGAGKINPRYTKHLLPALMENGFTAGDTASCALVVISRASGENYDNNAYEGEYYLSREEKEMLERVSSSYEHVIALINSGYPMDVRWLEEYHIEAALWCGFPGMLGGKAVSDILCGISNPCGKLPDTWSLDYFDHPSSANFYQPENPQEALDADHDIWINTVYEEDIYVGYRYFETFGKPVAFPFGHGLSYTSFETKAVLNPVSLDDLDAEDEILFSVTVTNTGSRPGKEVAAVYVRMPESVLEHPSLQLIAFGKTSLLNPGDSETLTLKAKVKYLAGYDETSQSWILETGEYSFLLGGSVSETRPFAQLSCSNTRALIQTGDYCRPNMEISLLSLQK